MLQNEGSPSRLEHLPVILIAAVVQGWALYGLHVAITDGHWPATVPAWLLAGYAVATLIPITIEMFAKSIRDKHTWVLLACTTALFFYFGWHHGSQVVDMGPDQRDFPEQWIPLGFALVVLWLLMLPFMQARIETGRWRAPYAVLFANAWNNKLVLLEAALFSGLFWLLLLLWQQLFAMLGIGFFKELFQKPLFIYPVTSIVFGIALHLIGSLDRITKVVLEQLLNVLKWLLTLAAIILTLFTIALAAKLPGMIASAERAISAAWLLWLVAVTVLLVNAAYRDGGVERAYPRPIANGLRFVIPLIAVIASIALYALYLRIDRYGLTVDRVWACIVAGAACVYGFGYALASRDTQWMGGIARVNVIAAVFLIVAIGLALTPVMSPYRLAAASQFEIVMQDRPRSDTRRADDPLHYLRFSAGEYGRRRLELLSQLQDHPNAEKVRKEAKAAIVRAHRWDTTPSQMDMDEWLSQMVLRPVERSLDAALVATLRAELAKPQSRWLYQSHREALIGLFVDMDADHAEEFVVVGPSGALVFQSQGGTWSFEGRLNPDVQPQQGQLLAAVNANQIRVAEPRWRNLEIGRFTLRPIDTGSPASALRAAGD